MTVPSVPLFNGKIYGGANWDIGYIAINRRQLGQHFMLLVELIQRDLVVIS